MDNSTAFLTSPALFRSTNYRALPSSTPAKRVRVWPCMKKGVISFKIPMKFMPESYKSPPPDLTETKSEEQKSTAANPETPKTVDEARELIRRHLGARVDVVILGIGSTDRFETALQAHPRRFNALVIAPTKMTALSAVAEIGEFSGSSRVIPVVGRGPHALSNPARTAMYQNNIGKGTIIVATPRALCNSFFKTGQGPKWMSLVERLVIYDPDFIYDTGCIQQLIRVIKYIPPTTKRQTVLIATEYPGKKVAKTIVPALRSNVRFIKWPNNDDTPESRAAKICRRYAINSPSGAIVALNAALNDARKVEDHKIVVFFNSAKFAILYAAIWRRLGVSVQDLHANRSNAMQMLILTTFAESPNGILFSSEMSAQRASDLNVTHVIEFGAPFDKKQHERRVSVATPGIGSGLLLIVDYERDMVFNALGEDTFKQLTVADCYMNMEDDEFVKSAHKAFGKAQWQLGAAGYLSFIELHSGRRKKYGWTRDDLVQRATDWAKINLGAGPWPVPPRFADRFGLWKVEGVKVDENMVRELSVARHDDAINVDTSLDGLDPRIGKHGRNVAGRRLKEKDLKIGDWKEIMKSVKESELKMLKTMNRKSPEGRKYLALISQKAIQRSLTPKRGDTKRLTKEREAKAAEQPSKRKKRIRIRPDSWAPSFVNKKDNE